jgi:hypothetical protein
MIPQGLPGAGNIMVFDNGGWAGYGSPNPASATGEKYATRDYSRVLEINPVTLRIEWQFTPKELGLVFPVDYSRFYSPFVSGAQRLPNGNTQITEGATGMLLEVTRDHQVVWEYVSPYWGKIVPINQVYRAYRVPYEWISPGGGSPRSRPSSAWTCATSACPARLRAGPCAPWKWRAPTPSSAVPGSAW